MIEYLVYILTFLLDILVLEFVIITGKVIYDDFFKKEETGYVKIDNETWEQLKEQTITFDGIVQDVEITKSGKFIKIVLDSKLIEYIVGTLINIDFESTIDAKGITVPIFAEEVTIGEIVAVKFKDGNLYRLKEGKDI